MPSSGAGLVVSVPIIGAGTMMGTDTTSPALDDGIKYHPTQTMAA